MRQIGFPLNLLQLRPAEKACCEKILNNTDAWIARNINKRISMPISIYLARAGITPNQITFFNLLLGVLAGLIASLGGYQNLVWAAVLFQLVSIIDGCDGEVAKLNNKTTQFGAWFDTVGDNLAFVLFIIGVTFGLYRETHAIWVVNLAKLSLFSFAILLCIMVSYLLKAKNSSASLVTYEKEVVSASAKKQNIVISKIVHYGKFLVKKDFFAFFFFLLALIDLPEAIVMSSALATTVIAMVLSGITIKQRRTAKALAAQPVPAEEVTGVLP